MDMLKPYNVNILEVRSLKSVSECWGCSLMVRVQPEVGISLAVVLLRAPRNNLL